MLPVIVFDKVRSETLCSLQCGTLRESVSSQGFGNISLIQPKPVCGGC